ncbi:alpha-2A adrenergic receptor-like [Stylophora pistillata]|uniref:alpha-2A adrenergic receptor-like n=1 Tax=Stylophora pistillata TaxID=50429 RepID=UPI000C040142|nr:alpha-2A adrenergic receptor-like [Stylophora pistillata]
MNETNVRITTLALELKTRERWLVGIESLAWLGVIVAAFLGNVLLTLAVLKTSTIRSRHNYYLMSLAATDVLNSAAIMPYTLTVLIRGKWPFGNFICQLQGSLTSICATVSLLTMALISFNRYVKIVRSVQLYQKIFTRRNILISIAMAWGITTFLVLVPFLFYKTMFRFHPGKCLCWLQLSLKDGPTLYGLVIYSSTVCLIFSSISFSYYKVFRKIRAHYAQVANSAIHSENSTAFAEEVKITAMLFVTILAFFICWVPSFVIDFYEAIAGYYILPRQLYFFNVFTYTSSSAINPLIYGVMNRDFRGAYKRILCCKEN